MTSNQGSRMRQDWDARARADARHYIATREGGRDTGDFYERGRIQSYRLTKEPFERLGFDPIGKRVLEIGCGTGRLFPGFAEMFGEIYGIDVPKEMIERGREECPVKGVHFILGSGRDLAGLDDQFFDYCFSYIVFQHIPSKDIVWDYLTETYRVLKPGGMFQLHFSKATAGTVIKSSALRILPPALHRPLAVAYRAATLRWVRGVPVRPAHVGSLRTWSGVSMSLLEVTVKLAETGFEEISILDDPGRNHRFWAIGKKPVLAG